MIFFKKKKEFDYPKEIVVNSAKFEIQVDFLKKKSSSVTIKNNLIQFRISSNLSISQKEEHFNSLLKRILKKLEKNPIQDTGNTFEKCLEQGYFIFSNQKYNLIYSHIKSIKFEDNTFYINPKLKLNLIEKHIIKILILKYTSRIKKYLDELNLETYNYKITGFHINNVNSKWGHCTHDNKIMLNLKLLNAPKEILNYVIFHEISHIKHKNHSSDFWTEVTRFCPNYKNLRRYLKENPPHLFMFK